MYKLLREAIESKDYELKDILKKINKMYVRGKITEVEADELSNLARKNADAENSVDVMKLINDLASRVEKLEKGIKTDVEEFPIFQLNKVYKTGDKITFDGKHYECIAPSGAVCVWSPADYPSYWKEM